MMAAEEETTSMQCGKARAVSLSPAQEQTMEGCGLYFDMSDEERPHPHPFPSNVGLAPDNNIAEGGHHGFERNNRLIRCMSLACFVVNIERTRGRHGITQILALFTQATMKFQHPSEEDCVATGVW